MSARSGWTVERDGVVDSTEPTRESAELAAAFRCATYGGTWKVRRYTASGGRTVRTWTAFAPKSVAA